MKILPTKNLMGSLVLRSIVPMSETHLDQKQPQNYTKHYTMRMKTQVLEWVLLSAEGPSSKDGIYSFCSGGDQKARGHEGYVGDDGYHPIKYIKKYSD